MVGPDDPGNVEMIMSTSAERDMAAYWDRAGRVWVEHRALLDRVMAPIAEAVVEAAGLVNGEAVLDVGCGAGATTLEAAWRVGPAGRSVGVDISGALVELARRRAGEDGVEGVEFLLADAQTHAFDPVFDAVVSRFGVMFFPDPIAAFANLRGALRPDGRLAFAAWRSPEENPLSLIPLRAAAPFLPEPPRFERDAPGRFAFADPRRIEAILSAAGWREIVVAPLDVASPLSFEDLMTMSLSIGPLNPVLKTADEALRRDVEAAVAQALSPYVQNGAAAMESACWLVTARG